MSLIGAEVEYSISREETTLGAVVDKISMDFQKVKGGQSVMITGYLINTKTGVYSVPHFNIKKIVQFPKKSIFSI